MDNRPTVLLRLRESFDAAHQLPYHKGKCARLHGHTFQIEVGVMGKVRQDEPDDPQSGMVCDFASVKSVLAYLLPDHYSINKRSAALADMTTPDAMSEWKHALANPTAENLAVKLYLLLKDAEKTFDGGKVAYVRVWETAKADVTYPAHAVLSPFAGA